MHEPTNPTLTEHGDETHPAFGMIQISRISTVPGAVLFDSSVKHGHLVRLTVTQATRKRDLHTDWIHAERQPLIEVDMSMAQWASAVSSLNTSGVPVTIRSTETNHDVPGLVAEERLAESVAETKAAAQAAFDKIKQAMAAVDALDPKASVKERRESLNRLRSAITGSTSNIDFTTTMLHEHTENVVQRVRADVEAMAAQHVQRLAVEGAPVLPLALDGGDA